MSVTPSQFSPVSECPLQSHYKSLIATIPVYIQPFINAITFT
ncbi:unnamed protein product [Staurois parvus]|uniref:Uncharacterized protein n=1 Tax=Staurois parvus TaxID=386267 RepID=A0ABN9EH19_9NEOB|nr:unnamed protein product [Staurois parvus]